MKKKNEFEKKSWELSHESSITKRNLKVTEILGSMKVPRKERKEVRNDFLKKANEIENLRARREENKREGNKRDIYDSLLNLARKEIRLRGIRGIGYIRIPDMVYNYDDKNKVWLVGGEGWQEDSWFRRAKWLFGRDDSGYWAVRVPSTCGTAREAIDWLKPAMVKRAEEEGRWVVRQGDTYFVELKVGRDNLDDLPNSHKYDPVTRIFIHDQHTPVTVPAYIKGIKAYRQTQLHAEGGRAYAD